MKVHVFPFSQRKGTPAATFPDQVSPEVRKQRMQVLGELERELAADYYRSLIGTTSEVLVERTVKERAGWVHGTDQRYVPVEFPGTENDIGEAVQTRGEAAFRHYLQASRLPDENE